MLMRPLLNRNFNDAPLFNTGKYYFSTLCFVPDLELLLVPLLFHICSCHGTCYFSHKDKCAGGNRILLYSQLAQRHLIRPANCQNVWHANSAGTREMRWSTTIKNLKDPLPSFRQTRRKTDISLPGILGLPSKEVYSISCV
jgi:hypothetical protein